jgi:POTRA domain, FtsQ-type
MDRHVKNYGNFKQYQTVAKKRPSFISFFKRNRQSNPISARMISMPQSSRYPSATRKNAVSWKRRIFLSSLFLVIISWIGLMLYLPYFRINKVEFAGLTLINHDEISQFIKDKYLSSKIIPKNNYFLVSKSKIAKDIAEKYATTKVEVTKIFPGVLSISIEEKITSIIYDNGSIYALLDNNGTVVLIIPNGDRDMPTNTIITSTTTLITNEEQAPVITASSSIATSTTMTGLNDKHAPDWRKLSKTYISIPILYDARRQTVAEKQSGVLSSPFINALIDLQAQIRETGVGEVRYFTTDNPVAGVSATTNKPWKILLQPSNSLTDQILNLKTLLDSRNVQPAEYIDLRYGERVFWK